MKHTNTFESFLNESDYTDSRFELKTKATELNNKKKELRGKVDGLNQSADDPKSAIQAQIATLKMSILDIDSQKIRINKAILDLNNKLSKL